MKASLIKLHIAVFLWGFTGVLGKLIQLNEGLLVWYRLLITIIALFLIMWRNGQLEKLPLNFIGKLVFNGFIIALHWVCFYGSIKAANVSIALVCLSSAGLFTAFLEPILLKTRIKKKEILLSLLGIAGIYLIFHFDSQYRNGIIIGIIATILSVVFSILNKQMILDINPKTMILYELSGGFLILTLFMPLYLHFFPTHYIFPKLQDWIWLILMSLLCTILAMDLSLQALKNMSVFTQNLTLNLEPVYGIILAFIIYKENKDLNTSFYLGFGLIALSVAVQMIDIIRTSRKKNSISVRM